MENDRGDLTLEKDFRKTLDTVIDELTRSNIQRLTNLFPKIQRREAHEIESCQAPAERLFDNLSGNGDLSSTNVDLLIENLEFINLIKAANILKRYKARNANLINAEIERQEQEQLPTPSPTKQPCLQEVDGKMPGKGMKNKIFISFSFSVEKEVTAIKEKIEREVGEGSCWICTTEIRAGDTLSKELTDAINGSDVMVCMINQKYIDSKICVEEFLLANELGKEIILVHLEKMEWPYKKSNRENSPMQLAATKLIYVRLYGEHKKTEFSKLITRLKEILGDERNASAVEENAIINSASTSSVGKRPSQDGGGCNQKKMKAE